MIYLYIFMLGLSSGLLIGGIHLKRLRISQPKFPYEYLDK